MESYKDVVFLGGTCNNSTWRTELISKLNKNVKFFNPVLNREWTKEDEILENKVKTECKLNLFVLTSEMKGVYSVAEVVDCSNKNPKGTMFCYLPNGFDKFQIKSLEATKRLVKSNGAKVFSNLDEIALYLNNVYTNVVNFEL